MVKPGTNTVSVVGRMPPSIRVSAAVVGRVLGVVTEAVYSVPSSARARFRLEKSPKER